LGSFSSEIAPSRSRPKLRAEAAYEVTRDFSLRFGFEVLQFGKGIGRGGDMTRNTEAVTLYGFTFGALLNR